MENDFVSLFPPMWSLPYLTLKIACGNNDDDMLLQVPTFTNMSMCITCVNKVMNDDQTDTNETKHHDEHLKPPQATTQTMRIKERIAPPTISFICRLCIHIFLLSCPPCLWKLSAWNCRFSLLSTRSSIFSPLSRTCKHQ